MSRCVTASDCRAAAADSLRGDDEEDELLSFHCELPLSALQAVNFRTARQHRTTAAAAERGWAGWNARLSLRNWACIHKWDVVVTFFFSVNIAQFMICWNTVQGDCFPLFILRNSKMRSGRGMMAPWSEVRYSVWQWAWWCTERVKGFLQFPQ